jgi:hypothetical protein
MVRSYISLLFRSSARITPSCIDDGSAISPVLLSPGTSIVVFRQSLPIEGKSAGNVFVALSRHEPGAVSIQVTGSFTLV